MPSLKQRFAEEVTDQYEKYFPMEALRDEGFTRQRCEETGRFFWSTTDRDVCGEPGLHDGFTFFENNPSSLDTDYIGVWDAFAEHMKDRGYASIDR
ncbi:MAG: hypothetical protein ABEI52_13375, partial [Halobacteriaceae archaeon]